MKTEKINIDMKEKYKNVIVTKVNDDITVFDCYTSAEKSSCMYVRIMFAYNKVYYTGDMGSYIFGKGVQKIKSFFRGSRINPYYWSEKVEAYSNKLIDTDVDEDRLRKEVIERLVEYDEFFDEDKRMLKSEVQEAIDDYFRYDFDSNEIGVYDRLGALLSDLGVLDAWEEAWVIISECQDYNYRFLYACTLLQWIENEYFEELVE